MDREQAEEAGRIIFEAELRQATSRRKERIEATCRRLLWGFGLLGLVAGIVIAPGFGGSRVVWGVLGAAAGRVAGWFVQRAWMNRSGGN